MKSLSSIAREMGVSSATVSYVYHNKWQEKRIRPELAAKIKRKLDLERAHPDMLGQQLRSGETQTAGVLLPNFDQPYFLNLLAGLEHRLDVDDYMLFLGNAHRGPQSRQTELLERMMARRVDMVILISPVPVAELPDMLCRIREQNVPVVFADNYLPDQDIPYVVSDNRWGANQAVSRALAEGRRRISFVGKTPDITALADRRAGYQEALEEAGVEAPEDYVLWEDQMGDEFEKRLRSMLAGPARPDAIFFDSLFGRRPIMAIAILAELGLRHPDDVLLCGFDHLQAGPETTVFRDTIRAPLLTVQQDAETMGTVAAEMALRGTRGETGIQSRLIRPSLMWETLQGGRKATGTGVVAVVENPAR